MITSTSGRKKTCRKLDFGQTVGKNTRASSSLLSSCTRLLRGVTAGTETMIQKTPDPSSSITLQPPCCVTSKKRGGQGFPDAPFRETERRTTPKAVPLTELGQYLFINSLMAMSFLCSFGPVWYHPTILSLAKQKQKGFGIRTVGRPQQRDLGRDSIGRSRVRV